MDIDERFPTKLQSVQDLPQPFRSVLANSVSHPESIRQLIHAPAFSTAGEKTPATVLAVTDKGWLVASETEDGGAHVEKSDFSETLFLELVSILLWGQLKVHFAKVGSSYSATITFDTVEEGFYREAVDLILESIDPTSSRKPEKGTEPDKLFESWPYKFRAEAKRYRPKGQPLLAAIQWPAIAGGFQRELCPAAALLISSREIVLISEEKTSPRQFAEDTYTFGATVTYFPAARLEDFHVGRQERFGVLELRAHARHGGEKLQILFPGDRESAVSKAMEQVGVSARNG